MTATNEQNSLTARALAILAGKHLAFMLGSEAIPALKAREIFSLTINQ